MPIARRHLIAAALCALSFASAASATDVAFAAGGSEKEAQTYFVEGMKLMGKKRYAEACESFAKSQELDPGMGTQYRLAECYEKLGRLASAYDEFNAVADAATAAQKPDRALVAKKRAAALEPRVAKLTIDVPPSVAKLKGVEVRRDGKPVDPRLWGTPIPVDSGDHIVTVTAPKKKPWEGKVWAEGSAKLLVSVAALEDTAKPASTKAAPRSKVPAIILGAAAGVGIVVGATFVGLRASAIGTANDLHDKIRKNDGNCVAGGVNEFITDCRSLSSATSAGDTFGTTSLVGFIVGGASAAAMVTYLLLPAPERAPSSAASGSSAPVISSAPVLRIAPVIGAGQGGIVARGSF